MVVVTLLNRVIWVSIFCPWTTVSNIDQVANSRAVMIQRTVSLL